MTDRRHAIIFNAISRGLEPGVYPDPGGMLAAVRDAVDPMLFGLRDRAQAAERERDEQRQRAARANVQATALLRRAETAERQAAEHKARAQRAEAERTENDAHLRKAYGYLNAARDAAAAPNWEVLADVVTAHRQRADTAEARIRRLHTELNEAVASGCGFITIEAVRGTLDTTLAETTLGFRALIDEQPGQFRAWLRGEIRRDPKWWREILRTELRLGWLREDFRRAGIRAD